MGGPGLALGRDVLARVLLGDLFSVFSSSFFFLSVYFLS